MAFFEHGRPNDSAAAPLSRHEVGRLGEAAAEEHIMLLGWTVVERNWRCRSGEVDLIATTPDSAGPLVFIEVRTRSTTSRYGTAAESVDARKQLQVQRTAQMYLHASRQHERLVRFDVIAVLLTRQGEVREVTHYEAAF
ncbi:YraN family protein [Paenibacillaceae bacterium]|nr:YraN family protein [Paenibacillaceae bacterium]